MLLPKMRAKGCLFLVVFRRFLEPIVICEDTDFFISVCLHQIERFSIECRK